MAQWNQDLEDLGRNIQEIVDRAVNSSDYQKLNETIRQTVGRAVDLGSEAVRTAVEKKNRKPEVPKTRDLTVLYSNPIYAYNIDAISSPWKIAGKV